MKNRYRRILLFLLSCVFCLAMTAGCGKSPAAQTGAAATEAAAKTTIAASEASGAAEASAAMGAEADTAEAEDEDDTADAQDPEDEAEADAQGTETETLETQDPEEEDETAAAEAGSAESQTPAAAGISESDTPTEKDELAEYIHVYGHLPSNFITKQEAKDLGWVSQEGNLWDVAPGCSIGGDRFSNYEGLLPEAPGRNYTECDVGYEGGRRNARRIVFSNDGLIYYTEDHYESFELLYGEE